MGTIMRQVIKIDEKKCDGCSLCAEACHEGAIQIINGKAKLVSDSYCDGLGDCIGECPRGAISFETREAAPYDEEAVKRNQAARQKDPLPCGCPGTVSRSLSQEENTSACEAPETPAGPSLSALSNWPIQLKLVPVNAPYLKSADVLLAADCAVASIPDFHGKYLDGKILLLGCPKLDNAQAYRKKLAEMIQANEFRSLHVVIMEVPCCGGLTRLAEGAVEEARKSLDLKRTVVDVRCKVLQEETLRYRFSDA
ncbi:MAG: ATP-binding protein [Thermovirgaceae bacterium]